MDITIRHARQADVPQLLELYKLLDTAPEPEMPLDQAIARFREVTCNPLHHLFVAESAGDGSIVGTFAMVYLGGLSHGARDSCIVEDVVVAPSFQGQGIGRRMMQMAMAHCAARDCYKLVLSSHLVRADAHRFYEGLGFRKHGYSYLIQPSAGAAAA